MEAVRRSLVGRIRVPRIIPVERRLVGLLRGIVRRTRALLCGNDIGIAVGVAGRPLDVGRVLCVDGYPSILRRSLSIGLGLLRVGLGLLRIRFGLVCASRCRLVARPASSTRSTVPRCATWTGMILQKRCQRFSQSY